MARMHPRAFWAVVAASALALSACAGGDGDADANAGTAATDQIEQIGVQPTTTTQVPPATSASIATTQVPAVPPHTA